MDEQPSVRGCRRWLMWIGIVGLLAFLLLAGAFWLAWQAVTKPHNPSARPLTLIVEEGDTVYEVAEVLHEAGLVQHPLLVQAVVAVRGGTILPGIYEIEPTKSVTEILAMLAAGVVSEEQVTFLEGWRVEEVADQLVAKGLIEDQRAFYEALELTSSSLATTPSTNPYLRGVLFPDTYRFAQQSTSSTIIDKLVDNFELRTDRFAPTYDQLVLASIVEREALHDEDRAKIAGVYTNRLDIGMKLDADPTVQFAKANQLYPDCVAEQYKAAAECDEIDWWPEVLRADYQGVESPYNTYRTAGLPPTPICSPGLASIQAAVQPEDHDYFYFVTDHDGVAHFATTLEEHNANVARYR